MYANEIGVKTLPYKIFNKNDQKDFSEVEFPSIVKPTRLGSSIGISIVKDINELEYALDVAFEFDNQALVEPFIEGIKEYNLAGCFCEGEYAFSLIEEPQKGEFLDFNKKYLDFSRTQKVFEADLDEKTVQALKNAFQKIYGSIFQGALIRCDFFVYENEVYINEINPVPGSLSNYLFDDFESVLLSLANNLPKEQKIICEYKYINSIQAAKGK
jgi:D-alanine-D-alanine ligase